MKIVVETLDKIYMNLRLHIWYYKWTTVWFVY